MEWLKQLGPNDAFGRLFLHAQKSLAYAYQKNDVAKIGKILGKNWLDKRNKKSGESRIFYVKMSMFFPIVSLSDRQSLGVNVFMLFKH